MVVSWFVWFMAAAVFVSMVLLAVVCLQCRNKGPLASIRQGNASDDYIQSEFRVVHPGQPTSDLNSVHSPLHLSPFSSSAERRQRSVTPTETESNPSYENPAAGSDYPESDADEPGYIIVLPDGESRASTLSSGAAHDYENVSLKNEDRDYLNVGCPHDSNDDDDDDDGNYVNLQEGAQTD